MKKSKKNTHTVLHDGALLRLESRVYQGVSTIDLDKIRKFKDEDKTYWEGTDIMAIERILRKYPYMKVDYTV